MGGQQHSKLLSTFLGGTTETFLGLCLSPHNAQLDLTWFFWLALWSYKKKNMLTFYSGFGIICWWLDRSQALWYAFFPIFCWVIKNENAEIQVSKQLPSFLSVHPKLLFPKEWLKSTLLLNWCQSVESTSFPLRQLECGMFSCMKVIGC